MMTFKIVLMLPYYNLSQDGTQDAYVSCCFSELGAPDRQFSAYR